MSSPKQWLMNITWVLLLGTIQVSSAQNQSTGFRACMENQLGQRFPNPFVFLPGDMGYTLRLGWSFQPDPNDHPVAFVDCAETIQIQKAVTCAIRQGLRVCPRCGGHSRIGSGMCSGVVIDVWQLKKFSVSPDNTTVTIGAGLTLGELVYRTYSTVDRIFPVGHSPAVGVSGFLLAGGLSELANDLGLGCDNVVQLRLINANGRKIVTNRNVRADLFWASCGGGGGRLGIVYELTLKLHPTSRYDSHVGFTASFSNSSLMPAYLEWLYSWQEENISILSRSVIDISRSSNQAKVTLRGACVDSPTTQDCRDRFQASGVFQFPWRPLLRRNSKSIQYLQFISGAAVSSDPLGYYNTSGYSHAQGMTMRSSNAVTAVTFKYRLGRAPPRQFFEDFFAFVETTCRAPGMIRCSILIQNLGSGITGIDSRATAVYGLRLAKQWISFRVQGSSLAMSENVKNILRDYLAPHSFSAFVNYEDRGLTDIPKAYYGLDASRMIRINKRLDRNHIFLSKQPLF
uniref:FAD-binding PCMH-type domain-containing protein n=1 Tax=Compsopogon caeruleus TaxID=31354 RepID=A0A7S1THW4_9RHOD|mmetsp:Transcript_8519/g.17266  ORF Transcript_8519/g.17266 Transcript_8519/m.17266 type:complete len:514 (+) Transcript_8519:152-1693(+)|eukprot:CAMPEP_0184685770 /NCGR_PEP_ID=MMETSP0312-20130426/20157_1 /TAXON_ID=31354 /ORGANISM="Compsopogon coeruleus, Strain SAG 36.94" /LENGTH=513 /DNA_ID=CAMNT_0027140209 /DNA_START=140 /DNA_END=1681 /DNA_ORIENTATION=-